jgi:hypothetical protein
VVLTSTLACTRTLPTDLLPLPPVKQIPSLSSFREPRIYRPSNPSKLSEVLPNPRNLDGFSTRRPLLLRQVGANDLITNLHTTNIKPAISAIDARNLLRACKLPPHLGQTARTLSHSRSISPHSKWPPPSHPVLSTATTRHRPMRTATPPAPPTSHPRSNRRPASPHNNKPLPRYPRTRSAGTSSSSTTPPSARALSDST